MYIFGRTGCMGCQKRESLQLKVKFSTKKKKNGHTLQNNFRRIF